MRSTGTCVSHGLGLSKHRFLPKDRLAETHSAISRQRSLAHVRDQRDNQAGSVGRTLRSGRRLGSLPSVPRPILPPKSLAKVRGLAVIFATIHAPASTPPIADTLPKEGLNKGLAQGRGAWRSFTGHNKG